jgi:membrane fusion protein (multidrug efflux system)
MIARLPVLLVLALTACGFAEADQAGEQHAPTPPSAAAARVEVATLVPSEAALDISLPGEVEGGRDALLASSLGGYVERVLVDDGQAVRRGQVLVEVDSEIYSAQVETAQAQLALAEADLRRLGELGDMATQADLDRADTQVKVTAANLRMARAQLDRAVVNAPFDGVVGGLDVEEGEVAGHGSPVVRLVQLDQVRVTLSVPDRDVVALQRGMELQVTASARSSLYTGTITKVGQTADLRTRAFTVEVEVPNPDHELLPGMIVRVNGQRSITTDAVVIPQEWVVTTLTDQGVFVAEDGVAVWRPVTLGDLVRDQVVVTSGLASGDRVVITGHRDLAPGDEVLVSREGTCCHLGRAVFGGSHP